MMRSVNISRAVAGPIVLALLVACTHGLSASPVPRPEHPRPGFQRDAWLSLNGTWDFALLDKPGEDPKDVTFDKKIVVPFPWQSRLSGVAAVKDGVGWYRREITVPPEWKGRRVFLRFDAVDQEAVVWLDGTRLGENKVAYTPFEFDITDRVAWGKSQQLVVRAVDLGSPSYPKGKQEGWYTPTGGIWQTVWLEARPAAHIDYFRVLPDVKGGAASFELDLRGDAADEVEVTVRSESDAFPAATTRTRLSGGKGSAGVTVRVRQPKLWHPDSPNLYEAVVEARSGKTVDVARTYFGLREVSRGKWRKLPYEYILLNGEPIYLRTALDQSFNPEGLYTAPSDAFLRRDMEIAKQSGLNGLRIHIKTEEPRRLYWADKLGVLILADIPNLGSHPPQGEKRCNWENTWRGAIRRDFNHPSIIAWVLFNETWGIRHDDVWDAWIEALYRETKKLDPTRLCEDNSPCRSDHVVTDINSWHFYINSYEAARAHIKNVVDSTHASSSFNYVKGRKQGIEPLINSEYGGIGAGSGDADISWCLKFLTNELRRYPKICGYVYTELTDIEWEHNGIVNYDRSAKEFGYDAFCPEMKVADIFAADFICMDSPPCPTRKPGDTVEVPLSFSHFSRQRLDRAKLVWQFDGVDRFGNPSEGLGAGRVEFIPKQYAVIPLPTIRIKLPNEQMVAALWCCVLAPDGRVVARNYVNLDVFEGPQGRVEVLDPRTVAVRWDPMLEEVSWPPPISPPDALALDKRAFEGSGEITYRIAWPDGVDPRYVVQISLLAEMAARAGKAKYDWPGPKGNHNYPQTQARKSPTDVEVLLGGEVIGRRTLADDPADARGVLSHVHGYDSGSYGYLESIVIEREVLRRIMAKVIAASSAGIVPALELTLRVPAGAEHRGGLAIFGDRLGRYPTDPTLIFVSRKPLTLKLDRKAAALKWLPVVPTALEGGSTWRYTTKSPQGEWFGASFDDSSWQEGRGGFGRAGTPGARIGTAWETSAIWLRKTFELPGDPVGRAAILRFHHDEDITVYLNGHDILRRKGYRTDYTTETLSAEVAGYLRKGKNLLAVRCRQTGGGQFVDFGLSVLAR
ncbi:MAG: hypothetical protein JXQ73_15535 [Phycisphaerae bacterium]|nr:hypothetical protein [Phycisphaerae bacterium]